MTGLVLGYDYFAIGFVVAIIAQWGKVESKSDLVERIIEGFVITVTWPLVLMIMVFRNDY